MSAPDDARDQTIKPWVDLSSELLEAIAAHSGFPIESANRNFQEEIRIIRATLLGDPTGRQATITGIDVREAFARNGKFCETSLSLDPARERLRTKVLASEDPAGMYELRQEIADYLEEAGKRSEEVRRRNQELTEKLQDRIAVLEGQIAVLPSPSAPARVSSAGEPTIDPCTGLGDWREAHKAIEVAQASPMPIAIAVFYVHRMNYVNARFGAVIGDKILLFCSQHLANTLLRPSDLLYRLKGPAFLALLEREDSVSHVENDLQRLLATPLNQYMETPARTVFLPIKMTGTAVSANETTSAQIREWIDQYVLKASTENRLLE